MLEVMVPLDLKELLDYKEEQEQKEILDLLVYRD
jgi:hypothetical protein